MHMHILTSCFIVLHIFPTRASQRFDMHGPGPAGRRLQGVRRGARRVVVVRRV